MVGEAKTLPSRCASRANVPVGTWRYSSEVTISLMVSTSAEVSCCGEDRGQDGMSSRYPSRSGLLQKVVFGPSDLIEVDVIQEAADVVAALSNGRPATTTDIQAALGVTPAIVAWRLKTARERGLIQVVYGEHRGWVMCEEG